LSKAPAFFAIVAFESLFVSEVFEEDVVSDELLPEDVLSDFEEPLLVSEEVLLSELEKLLLSLSDAELDIPPSALEAFVSVPESLLQAAKEVSISADNIIAKNLFILLLLLSLV
jgi:hypothetical protein